LKLVDWLLHTDYHHITMLYDYEISSLTNASQSRVKYSIAQNVVLFNLRLKSLFKKSILGFKFFE